MSQIVEAVYEGSMFRPLEPVQLEEGQSVTLAIESVKRQLRPDEILTLAHKVYEGPAPEEIDQVEAIALDHSPIRLRFELQATRPGGAEHPGAEPRP